MKPFAKRLLALASAAALTAGTVPAVQGVYREETTYEGVADWALLEVTAMERLGLIPEDMSVTLAAAMGIPLLKYNPRSAAAKACRRIANRIQGLPEAINIR